MTDRDTSRPGPVALFVLAAGWLGLGVWAAASFEPSVLHLAQLVGYPALALGCTAVGLRRLRARRTSG